MVWSGCMCAKSLQSRPTLCDPRDCNPPGPSVHGILQARILKWVATPSSRGSSQIGRASCRKSVDFIKAWTLSWDFLVAQLVKNVLASAG